MFFIRIRLLAPHFKNSALPVPGTDTAVPECRSSCDGFQGPSSRNSCDIVLGTILNHTHVNMLMLHEDGNPRVGSLFRCKILQAPSV